MSYWSYSLLETLTFSGFFRNEITFKALSLLSFAFFAWAAVIDPDFFEARIVAPPCHTDDNCSPADQKAHIETVLAPDLCSAGFSFPRGTLVMKKTYLLPRCLSV